MKPQDDYLPRMPASPSFAAIILNQIARRNRTRLLKKLGKHRDTPWMRPAEEDLIKDVLRALQPMRCLEWGGGMSTLQFPALLPAAATWRTIEHDTAWAKQLSTMVTRPGVEVRHVAPDDPGFTGDGDEKSFASYLAAADDGGPYDLVFIDGRSRAACVQRALRLVSPQGVVILHDANRDYYLEPTKAFAHQLLFRDFRATRGKRVAGGVWLGSPQRDLRALFDVQLHERVWAFYRGVGRLFA
jgi:predicted O-methyltransferase YrrM